MSGFLRQDMVSNVTIKTPQPGFVAQLPLAKRVLTFTDTAVGG
jgi:hypothetical protein